MHNRPDLSYTDDQVLRQSLFRQSFGFLSNVGIVSKRVIVTPAVNPRLAELLHFNIQSTGQKSLGSPTVESKTP